MHVPWNFTLKFIKKSKVSFVETRTRLGYKNSQTAAGLITEASLQDLNKIARRKRET